MTPKIWHCLKIRYVHAKFYYNKGIFLLVSGKKYLTLLFITFGTLCGAIYRVIEKDGRDLKPL